MYLRMQILPSRDLKSGLNLEFFLFVPTYFCFYDTSVRVIFFIPEILIRFKYSCFIFKIGPPVAVSNMQIFIKTAGVLEY